MIVKKKTIKVCFFSGDITRSGGTERVSSIVANELVKDEYINVSFISMFEENSEPFFELDNRIERNVLYKKRISGMTHFLGIMSRVHKFVKDNNVDILIDIDGILDMYSIPALIGTKTKIVSWEQFNYYQNPYVPYRKYTRRLAAKFADAIVVLTKDDKENYIRNLKIRNRIRHIYNPIVLPNEKIRYSQESKTIITVGRLCYEKGLDYLVEIANGVLKKYPEWKWEIIGEGQEERKLIQKIEQYGLKEKLILKGSVKNISECYTKGAIFVLTSRFEGFGLVLTEAKAYRLPCISFKCPSGPQEIILDSVNGYLIECFDVSEMINKISKLIEDSELRVRFSCHSLDDTDKYNIYNVICEWKKLIKELFNE